MLAKVLSEMLNPEKSAEKSEKVENKSVERPKMW
jgi:hypothetical protein